MKHKRSYFIRKIKERSGMSLQDIEMLLSWAELNLGVKPSIFYKYKFETLTKTRQAIKYRKIRSRNVKKKRQYRLVSSLSNLSKEQIELKIKDINNLGLYMVDINTFGKYQMFTLEEAQIKTLLLDLSNLKADCLNFRNNVKLYYNGKYDISMLTEEYQQIYDSVNSILPEAYINSLMEKLSECDISDRSSQNMRAIAVDMEACSCALNYKNSEFVSFNFVNEKNLGVRLSYLSDDERYRILTRINSLSALDILDDKSASYSQLKEYYKRDLLHLTYETDFSKFRSFVLLHPVFCVKPTYGSIGAGVKKVSVFRYGGIRKMYDRLLSEYANCVLEELIRASNPIKKLNKDSVNVVRLTTMYNGSKTIIDDTFIKVGRKGSFIDNGGAGGILVHVDSENGVLDSDGCDEKGRRYTNHPDNGIIFKNYKLPDWEQAKELGIELGSKIEGAKYIGWDIAHSRKHGWVVVEGNAYTQFYGQQCTVLEGKRDAFLNTVGITELKD